MSDRLEEFPPADGVDELSRWLEALLFLSPDPLTLTVLCELTAAAPGQVNEALKQLRTRLGEQSGTEVAEVAGGYAMRTRAEYSAVCDRLRERPPDDRLSPAAMETLAVVAYLEPVSRPDIGKLRGVSVDSVVGVLLERGLIEEAGRADGTGAVLYRTSRAFQERFDLRGPGDLPPLERFELSGPQAGEIRSRLTEAGHLSAEDDANAPEDESPESSDDDEGSPVVALRDASVVSESEEDGEGLSPDTNG